MCATHRCPRIGALELAVRQTDDPEAVAGILDAIKILIADKYKRLRERLEELHAAEEISDTAFNAAFLALGYRRKAKHSRILILKPSTR